MPFQINGIEGKKLFYNGTEVKSAYYNNVLFFQSAKLVVGSITLTSDTLSVSISDLPFVPDGCILVSEDIESTAVFSAIYVKDSNIKDVYISTKTSPAASDFEITITDNNFTITIPALPNGLKWSSSQPITYIAWLNDAGVYGSQSIGYSGSTSITVSDLTFPPTGIFAISNSRIGTNHINIIVYDSTNEIETKYLGRNLNGQPKCTISETSITIGSDNGKDKWGYGQVLYFIWG